MKAKYKYVILGDARSPHILKWIKELNSYFDLYAITFQSCSNEVKEIIPENKCYEFNLPTKQSGNNYHLILSFPRLKKLIKQINPDIVNAHYITSYGFLSSISKTKTSYLILSAWGTDILVDFEESVLKNKIVSFAINKAHLITSDSMFMTEKIKRINNQVRILTFPFGLNKLPEVDFNQKKSNLFFSNRALTKNYRIDNVLKLFAEIKKYYQDAELIVANIGNELPNLKVLATELNIASDVKFVGYLNEQLQNEYYTKAQYYFTVPESDATSVSLLEAMAYGCVPIVSDIPANREWIEHLKNGLIVNYQIKITDELAKLDEKKIFELNRAIIKQKAIFPEQISNFVQYIYNHFK